MASVLVNTVDGDDMSGGSEDGAVAGVVEDIPRHGALIPLLSKSGLSSEKKTSLVVRIQYHLFADKKLDYP